MPVKSERQKLLDDLERALYQAVLMNVFDEDDDVLDPSEPSLLDELATLLRRIRALIARGIATSPLKAAATDDPCCWQQQLRLAKAAATPAADEDAGRE
ncbi:hypothetical protein PF003_g23138 [Phytophthora fragariae]|nr:hypothetical protein PF003_g23138 [Phytophthora fragariae]